MKTVNQYIKKVREQYSISKYMKIQNKFKQQNGIMHEYFFNHFEQQKAKFQ